MVAQARRPGRGFGHRQIESWPPGHWSVRWALAAAAASAFLILWSVGAAAAAQEPDEPDDHAAQVEDAQADQEYPRLSAHARDGNPRTRAAPLFFRSRYATAHGTPVYFFVLVFVGVVVVVVFGGVLGCRGGTGEVISVAVYSTRVPVK